MTMIKLGREIDEELRSGTQDPVLSMLGVGRHLWEQESGERFIERLRSEDSAVPPPESHPVKPTEDLPQAVWRRIEQFQGEQFFTRKGLPLTYAVEGNGIWFFRNGERINRKLTRAQVDVGISRCPLKSTTEINDLMDYPYLFAVLMDQRIRGEAW